MAPSFGGLENATKLKNSEQDILNCNNLGLNVLCDLWNFWTMVWMGDMPQKIYNWIEEN